MGNTAVVDSKEEIGAEPVAQRGTFNPLNHPISLTYPARIAMSAWIGHVPFGMYLIDVLRPKTIVELGTHYGVSYCAFCQAIKELGLGTRCYAIDSWEGDVQAGFYGPDVLAELEAHHHPLYGGFSRLIQSTFDDALNYFADQTLDLLHIDGFHTYETVKGDFETWLPKLTDSGVVLLHDINVRERDFGVWRLWEELKLKFPHFEFTHSHGLGLIAVGKRYPPELNELFSASAEEATRIRLFFSYLGARLEAAQELQLSAATSDEVTGQPTEKEEPTQIAVPHGVPAIEPQTVAYDEGGLLLEIQRQLAERDQFLRAKDLQVEELEQRLLWYVQSDSYRLGRALTRPLRGIKKLFG